MQIPPIPAYDPDDFVYLDVETTGLNPREHGLLEFSYAIGNEEPRTIVPHSAYDILVSANPGALKVNKFLTRFAADPDVGFPVTVPVEFATAGPYGKDIFTGQEVGTAYLEPLWTDSDVKTNDFFNEFLVRAAGKTPVGANVHFDMAFLEAYLTPEPLTTHHRILSLNAWVAGRIGYPGVVSFSEALAIADDAIIAPYGAPPIDHTAGGDVKATRFVHQVFNQYTPVDVIRY